MGEYEAEARDIIPEEIYLDIHALRRCQAYIAPLPDGDTREDFHRAIKHAFNMLHEIMYEHGIESYEDMVAFENGDFSKWTSGQVM